MEPQFLIEIVSFSFVALAAQDNEAQESLVHGPVGGVEVPTPHLVCPDSESSELVHEWAGALVSYDVVELLAGVLAQQREDIGLALAPEVFGVQRDRFRDVGYPESFVEQSRG